MGFCKIMLIGNLGRDPEMRYTPDGKAVTEFSVAVNQSRRDKQSGEWSDETDWFRVTVWGERAERTAEEFRKGNRVFVEGRFRTREYEARDGAKKMSLDVTADNVMPLAAAPKEGTTDAGTDEGTFGYTGTQPAAAGPAAAAAPPTTGTQRQVDDLDDLPF